jgi:hypothetical protein
MTTTATIAAEHSVDTVPVTTGKRTNQLSSPEIVNVMTTAPPPTGP